MIKHLSVSSPGKDIIITKTDIVYLIKYQWSYQVIGDQVLEGTSDGLRSEVTQRPIHPLKHLPQLGVHLLQGRLSAPLLPETETREEELVKKEMTA